MILQLCAISEHCLASPHHKDKKTILLFSLLKKTHLLLSDWSDTLFSLVKIISVGYHNHKCIKLKTGQVDKSYM